MKHIRCLAGCLLDAAPEGIVVGWHEGPAELAQVSLRIGVDRCDPQERDHHRERSQTIFACHRSLSPSLVIRHQ